MTEETHKEPNYIAIFGILVAAFVASVFLDYMSSSPVTVTLIFVIAAVKAYLVVMNFMHLKAEPTFLKWMVISLILVLVVMYIGMVVDIVYVFGDGTP